MHQDCQMKNLFYWVGATWSSILIFLYLGMNSHMASCTQTYHGAKVFGPPSCSSIKGCIFEETFIYKRLKWFSDLQAQSILPSGRRNFLRLVSYLFEPNTLVWLFGRIQIHEPYLLPVTLDFTPGRGVGEISNQRRKIHGWSPGMIAMNPVAFTTSSPIRIWFARFRSWN